MNAQDIVTRVRRTFGDEAAVQISDDDIIRWINDGQVEVVKQNDSALQKTGLIDLVANQSTYTLPADLFILRSLRYKFSDMSSFSALRYLNMQQFDESVDGWDGTLYQSTNPVWFTKYEGNVILFPTPDKANVGGLKVLYNQRPTDVTTLMSNLALPLIYHNSIVKYCMWQASLLDEDFDPSSMYRSDFASDMNTLSKREVADPVAVYPTITVLSDDL